MRPSCLPTATLDPPGEYSIATGELSDSANDFAFDFAVRGSRKRTRPPSSPIASADASGAKARAVTGAVVVRSVATALRAELDHT